MIRIRIRSCRMGFVTNRSILILSDRNGRLYIAIINVIVHTTRVSKSNVPGPIMLQESDRGYRFGMADMQDRGLFFPNVVKTSRNGPQCEKLHSSKTISKVIAHDIGTK